MLVHLTPKEVAQCNQAAAMRWQLARASGVVNQRRDKGRSDADLDLLGVKAELAVSKVFDLDHIHVGVGYVRRKSKDKLNPELEHFWVLMAGATR